MVPATTSVKERFGWRKGGEPSARSSSRSMFTDAEGEPFSLPVVEMGPSAVDTASG